MNRTAIVMRGMSVVAVLGALWPKFLPHIPSNAGARWVVFWDGSASMAETDGPGGQRRWDQARSAWAVMRKGWSHAIVKHYVVGDEVVPVEEPDLESYNPRASRMAVDGMGGSWGRFSPDAVLVLSDGRWNEESPWTGSPLVFTVGVGALGTVPDVAADAVETSGLAYAGEPFEVAARLSRRSGGVEEAKVTLHMEGISHSLPVQFSSPTVTVRWSVIPKRPGLARCRVEVSKVKDETSLENNRRWFGIDVQRNRLRTLYIAGRPSVDYNFLRSQLKLDPAVELVSFVVLRDPGDALPYDERELSLIPFPSALELAAQLRTFDVVILEDWEGLPLLLGPVFFDSLKTWVEEGGGFMSVQESPGPSPLSPWEGPLMPGPRRFQLSPAPTGHPVMELEEGETNDSIWTTLSPLEGDGLFPSKMKNIFRAVAVEPVSGLPVISAGEMGKGRLLAFANKTSWRWALGSGRRGEGPVLYQKFWENVVRWLACSPGSGGLKLVRPRGVLTTGSPIPINVSSSGGRCPRVWVTSAGGERRALEVKPTEQTGRYRALWVPDLSGPVEIRAESSLSARDRMWVDVSSPWDESADTRPDFDRLRTWSAATGGGFTEAGKISVKGVKKWFRRVSTRSQESSGNSRPFLILAAIGVLCAEWLVRRWKGLP